MCKKVKQLNKKTVIEISHGKLSGFQWDNVFDTAKELIRYNHDVQGHLSKSGAWHVKVSRDKPILQPVRIETIKGATCVVIQSKMNYDEDNTLPFDLKLK